MRRLTELRGDGQIQETAMASWLLQKVALAAYRSSIARHFIRTGIGSAIFAWSYDLYKTLLEVPGGGGLARQIRAGMWVIDVGANIGYFSSRFGRWVSGGGRVIAIEPDAANLELLRRRLARGKIQTVDICHAAATNRGGTVHLQRNPDHPGDHRIAQSGDLVAAVTLDDLVERAGNPEIALIKIDTQGSERLVLQGAVRTLERCKPALFIEIDDGALRQYGTSGEQVIRELAGAGYRFYTLSGSGDEAAIETQSAIESLGSEKRGYVDLLCIHPSRQA